MKFLTLVLLFICLNSSYSQTLEDLNKLKSNLLIIDSLIYGSDSTFTFEDSKRIEKAVLEIEKITGIKTTVQYDHLGMHEFIYDDFRKWLVWYIKNEKSCSCISSDKKK